MRWVALSVTLGFLLVSVGLFLPPLAPDLQIRDLRAFALLQGSLALVGAGLCGFALVQVYRVPATGSHRISLARARATVTFLALSGLAAAGIVLTIALG
jgi:hypothetical protein